MPIVSTWVLSSSLPLVDMTVPRLFTTHPTVWIVPQSSQSHLSSSHRNFRSKRPPLVLRHPESGIPALIDQTRVGTEQPWCSKQWYHGLFVIQTMCPTSHRRIQTTIGVCGGGLIRNHPSDFFKSPLRYFGRHRIHNHPHPSLDPCTPCAGASSGKARRKSRSVCWWRCRPPGLLHRHWFRRPQHPPPPPPPRSPRYRHFLPPHHQYPHWPSQLQLPNPYFRQRVREDQLLYIIHTIIVVDRSVQCDLLLCVSIVCPLRLSL